MKGECSWEPYEREPEDSLARPREARSDNSHNLTFPPDQRPRKDLSALNRQIDHLHFKLGCLTWAVIVHGIFILALLAMVAGWIEL